MNTEQHRRKGLRIMGALIGLVKPCSGDDPWQSCLEPSVTSVRFF